MREVTRGAWAQAICNSKFICVETYSGYGGGHSRDPKGKQHFLDSGAPDESLGNAVLDALAHSRSFVASAPRTDVQLHPEVEFDMELYDYKLTAERYVAWVKELMERYGYKTKRALFKDMKTCFIARVGSSITFRPSRHEKLELWGRSKGDEFEDVVIPADSTPAEIGAAMRLGFSRCIG
jgi:hypothetical protein